MENCCLFNAWYQIKPISIIRHSNFDKNMSDSRIRNSTISIVVEYSNIPIGNVKGNCSPPIDSVVFSLFDRHTNLCQTSMRFIFSISNRQYSAWLFVLKRFFFSRKDLVSIQIQFVLTSWLSDCGLRTIPILSTNLFVLLNSSTAPYNLISMRCDAARHTFTHQTNTNITVI